MSFLSVIALAIGGALLGAQTPAAPTITRAPEILTSVPPVYPDSARKERRGGVVALQVTIDETGGVARVEVVESAGADLDWAALGALMQFTFTPAEINGKPAPVAITYRLGFEVPKDDVAPPVAAPKAEASEARATFTLSGRVRRAGGVQPVAFAEVAVSELLPGTVGVPRTLLTDVEGRFTLALVPEGPYRIEVGIEGYEPFEDEQYLYAGQLYDLDIALVPLRANDFETVVRRQRREPPVSRISLSREEVRAIPGTYGDALRVIESLPGVARAPLLGGALMVRGGYPADTAIHFEGVPIPVLYHFGGFTSVINGAFIEEISFMPGGFPVRYGNATAGVVDVRAHALDNDTFKTHFDVDLFDFGFFFGGHVKPKFDNVALDALPELKVGFAARRSHAELPGSMFLGAAAALQQPIPFLPVPLYDDYQLKLESEVTSTSKLSLFVFGAEDSWAVLGDPPTFGTGPDGEELEFDDLLNTFLGSRFHRVLGSWEYRPVSSVTNTLRPYFGTTRRGVLSDGVAVPLLSNAALDTPTDEVNWGLRDELAVRITPWLRALAGFEHNAATYTLTILPPTGFTGGPIPEDPDALPESARAALSTAALYGELQVGPIAGLSIVPAVRAELSSLSFEDTRGLPIYDGASTSIVDAWTIDPRVSLRYAVSPRFTLKGAGGTFHRRPRAQSAAIDNDGDPLASPGALQVIGGFESKLADFLTLDAQVYGTKRYELTRERARFYVPGRPPFGFPFSGLGSFDSYGSGDTIGLELLLRVPMSKYFFGWVSYTFSRTEVRLGDQREERVPFPFDQTHNFIAVGRVNLPWEVTLGGRFAYVTGNPSPLPDSVTTSHDLNSNFYSPVLSSLRSSRLQDYHRLDLRIDKRVIQPWWSGVVFLEVVNVYNWPNPEVVFPGGDYRSRELRTLLPGPPVLPLLGAELDL